MLMTSAPCKCTGNGSGQNQHLSILIQQQKQTFKLFLVMWPNEHSDVIAYREANGRFKSVDDLKMYQVLAKTEN